jgi:phage terminase large subunit
VSCSFDLGIDDLTAIWFWQWAGQEVHWINYMEGNGVSMVTWAERIEKLGYSFDRIVLPHDARAREKGTGKSVFEVLQARGMPVEIAPNVQVYDGIEACRAILSRSWFDTTLTRVGRDRLAAYRRERDPRTGALREQPTHDISSHGADSFRYATVTLRPPVAIQPRRQTTNSWLAS